MFAVLSAVAGVGLGWLTALAGSVKIINWLTVPTGAANVIHALGRGLFTVDFYTLLRITRLIGIVIIAVSLPLLWWRFRRDDRAALTGVAWSMLIVVLFVPAALPWYYSWPLAVAAPLAQSRRAIAAIAGLSTWVMVIFKPDGSHGMYSWLHFWIATACALTAWYVLYSVTGPARSAGCNPGGQYAIAWARRTTSRAWWACNASTGRALLTASREPSRVMVSDGSGVNSQRIISVSR